MKNTENTKGNNRKTPIKRIGMVVILVLFIVIAGFAVRLAVAKYYAYKYEQGISVASAFYFNSNKLLKVPGATTADAIRNMDTSDMPVNINESKWVSGDCLFEIEIRNYDNNLLFNEADLDTGYEVCFYLLGTPKGARYYVVDTASGAQKELTADDKMQFFTGQLQGGTLSRDKYQIRIHLNSEEEYNEETKVLVVAYPTSPEYLYSADNQEHRLAGVFQGHYSEPYMRVDSADFMVEQESDYTDITWRDKVEDLSGLIFNIKTTGDVITDENNAVKQEAVVKWKSEYVQISEYDEYYLAAKKEAKTDSSWLKTETDANGDKWTYMKIKVLPYSSVNITFYKATKFLEEFGHMTKAEFEGMADACVEETQD